MILEAEKVEILKCFKQKEKINILLNAYWFFNQI